MASGAASAEEARISGRRAAPASAAPTSCRRGRSTPPPGAAVGAKARNVIASSGQTETQLRQTWHSDTRCRSNGSSAPWQSATQRWQSLQRAGSTWIR